MDIELIKNTSIVSPGITKAEIKSKAENLAILITNSGDDLFKYHSALKRQEKFIEEVLGNKDFKEAMNKEVEAYGKEKALKFGIEYEMANSTRYDYKNDPTWVELNDKLKAREKFLQSIHGTSVDEVDEETGEVRKVFGAIKTSTESIRATIK